MSVSQSVPFLLCSLSVSLSPLFLSPYLSPVASLIFSSLFLRLSVSVFFLSFILSFPSFLNPQREYLSSAQYIMVPCLALPAVSCPSRVSDIISLFPSRPQRTFLLVQEGRLEWFWSLELQLEQVPLASGRLRTIILTDGKKEGSDRHTRSGV